MKQARALLRRICDAVARRHSSLLARQFVESLEPRRLLTAAPQVISASFEFEHSPPTLKVQFDQDVSASLSLNDLVLSLDYGEWGMTPASRGFTYSYDAATNTALFENPAFTQSTYDLSGNYIATIAANSVTNADGQPLQQGVDVRFWFNVGDVNRDRRVDFYDWMLVNNHMNTAGSFTWGDANFDGFVDQQDIDTRIGNHWGWDLPASPDAPRGLSLLSISATQNKLAWIDDLHGEGGFRIQRSTDGASYTTLTTTAADVTEYVDSTAISGTSYWYRIRGVGGLSQTYRSEWDTAYSYAVSTVTPFAAPTSLATANAAAHTVDLSWQDNSSGENGFEIWGSRSDGAYKRLVTTTAGISSITLDTLAASTTYQFKVRAVSDTAVSAYSDTASTTTIAGAPIVMSGEFRYQTSPHALDFEFDQNVNSSLTNSDLNVTNLSNGAQVSLASVTKSYTSNIAHFSNFPGSVFANGNYEAILDGSGISATQAIGNDYSLPFFILAGDANRDRVIDMKDWDVAQRYQGVNGVGFSQANFNYDNVVNGDDIFGFITPSWGVQLPPPPSSPNSLTATSATEDPSHEIALNWTAPASGTWDGFRVWQSTDNVNFTQVAEIDDPDTRNWTDTGLTDGTKYTYRVRAYTAAAGNSASTNKASAVTVLIAPTLSAASPSSSAITWSWQNNSANPISVTLEVTQGNGTFETLGTFGTTTSSFTLSNLKEGTDYQLRVQGFNAVAQSAPIIHEAATRPQQPSALSATPIAGGKVFLTWDDNSHGEDGFLVQRKAGAGGWEMPITIAAEVTDFTDTTAVAGTDYTYQVAARNSAGDSPYSQLAQTTAIAGTGNKPVHAAFDWQTATHKLTFTFDQSVQSTFTANDLLLTNLTTGEQIAPDDMHIEFSDAGKTATVAFPDVDTSEFPAGVLPEGNYEAIIDHSSTGMVSDWSYQFYFLDADAAHDRNVNSLDFNEWVINNTGDRSGTFAEGDFNYDGRVNSLDFTNLAARFGTVQPEAPLGATSLLVETDGDHPETALRLSWTPVTGVAGYHISRSENGAIYEQVKELTGAGTSEWIDTDRISGVNYTYIVRSYTTAGGDSVATNKALGTVVLIPPSGSPTPPVPTSSGITISWQNDSGEATSYIISISTNGGETFDYFDEVDGDASSYEATGLAPDEDYQFEVTAANGESTSAPLAFPTIHTLAIQPPSGLSGSVFSANRIDLVWTNLASEATGIQIDWSANGSDFAPLTTVDVGTTSFHAEGLTSGTAYTFQVTAIADNGVSQPSSPVTTMTKPLTPSGLSATDNPDLSVTVKWNPVASADYYEVQRRKTGTTPWTLLSTNSASTSYADDGGDHVSEYEFQVRAHNATGFSEWSAASKHAVAPKAPASFSWVGSSLQWVQGSTNVQYYELDDVSSGFANPFAVLSGTATSAAVGNAPAGTFRIRARNGVFTDPVSTSSWVYVTRSTSSLSTSQNIPWSAAFNGFYPNGQGNIDITEFSPRAVHLIVERKVETENGAITPNQTGWVQIGTIPPGSSTLTVERADFVPDWSSEDWADYTFRVYAAGTSPTSARMLTASEFVDIELDSQGTVELQPNFTASVNGEGVVTISNGLGAWVSRDNLHWQPCYRYVGGKLHVNSSSGAELHATPGSPIYLRGLHNAGFTGYDGFNTWSTPVVLTPSVLSAPTPISAIATPNGAHIMWNDGDSGVTNFEIQASTDGASFVRFNEWQLPIQNYANGRYGYTDPLAINSAFRFFRVRAVAFDTTGNPSTAGHSPWSPVAQIYSSANGFTPHRTGGKFGEEVTRTVQDGGDPLDYVVLTNNDYEEHDDYSAKDFDDALALITNGVANTDADGKVIDDDLVKLTLKQLPAGLSDGTFKLEASVPSAVRFFDTDGHQLTNTSLDLANPSGYLAGLTSGDVDVWMEGRQKASDLIIKAGYKDPAGYELARDTVHMTLAEWNFVGESGQPIKMAESEVQELLLERSLGNPQNSLSGRATFKLRVDGIPSNAFERIVFESDNGDSFEDAFVTTGGAAQSSDFIDLYHSDESAEPLTLSEKERIRLTMQRNTLHNPTGKATTKILRDEQGRPIVVKPRVWVSVSSDAIEGAGPVKFRVQRDGNWPRPVTVNLEASGTATPDVDYAPALPTSISIPAGADQFVIVAAPTIQNNKVEFSRTVKLKIKESDDYEIVDLRVKDRRTPGFQFSRHKFGEVRVFIDDDDTGPMLARTYPGGTAMNTVIKDTKDGQSTSPNNCQSWAFNLTDGGSRGTELLMAIPFAVKQGILDDDATSSDVLYDAAMMKRVLEAMLYDDQARVQGYRGTATTAATFNAATLTGWHKITAYFRITLLAQTHEYHYATEDYDPATSTWSWSDKEGAAGATNTNPVGESGSMLGYYLISTAPRQAGATP